MANKGSLSGSPRGSDGLVTRGGRMFKEEGVTSGKTWRIKNTMKELVISNITVVN